MRISALSFIVLFGLTGCCSFKNIPRVVYYQYPIEVVEGLYPEKDYSIFDYSSPFVGFADNEKHIPAHYQLLLPPKKDMRKIYEREHNRCFVYSKKRGIAIIQELYSWREECENGVREISKEEVERWISKGFYWYEDKIKVKDNKQHYLFVSDEIRIVMFNLSRNDYHDFVELPLDSFIIKRRGEVLISHICLGTLHRPKAFSFNETIL